MFVVEIARKQIPRCVPRPRKSRERRSARDSARDDSSSGFRSSQLYLDEDAALKAAALHLNL